MEYRRRLRRYGYRTAAVITCSSAANGSWMCSVFGRGDRSGLRGDGRQFDSRFSYWTPVAIRKAFYSYPYDAAHVFGVHGNICFVDAADFSKSKKFDCVTVFPSKLYFHFIDFFNKLLPRKKSFLILCWCNFWFGTNYFMKDINNGNSSIIF